MTAHPPIAVRAETAARMLDMSAAEFRRLVDAGALPPAQRIGNLERWNVEAIAAAAKGTAPKIRAMFEL